MLIKSLIANAIFSGSSALIILVFGSWFNHHVQMPQWIYLGIGIGLLIFAIQLGLMVKLDKLREKLINSVIVSDIAWVLITGGMLLGYSESVSNVGVFIILAVNVIVSILAWLQYLGRRESKVI